MKAIGKRDEGKLESRRKTDPNESPIGLCDFHESFAFHASIYRRRRSSFFSLLVKRLAKKGNIGLELYLDSPLDSLCFLSFQEERRAMPAQSRNDGRREIGPIRILLNRAAPIHFKHHIAECHAALELPKEPIPRSGSARSIGTSRRHRHVRTWKKITGEEMDFREKQDCAEESSSLKSPPITTWKILA